MTAETPPYARPGISLGEALTIAAQDRHRARCTCRPGDTCPTHQTLIDDWEAERADRAGDVEEYIGGFDPDYHWPRDLAPRGL